MIANPTSGSSTCKVALTVFVCFQFPPSRPAPEPRNRRNVSSRYNAERQAMRFGQPKWASVPPIDVLTSALQWLSESVLFTVAANRGAVG
jgi:hypothetical protein